MAEWVNIIKNTGLKDPTFKRLAIANYMDGTTGACWYCKHKYIDVDDVIEKEPHIVEKGDKDIIACKKCYEEHQDSKIG
jgi:hypothetical protein